MARYQNLSTHELIVRYLTISNALRNEGLKDANELEKWIKSRGPLERFIMRHAGMMKLVASKKETVKGYERITENFLKYIEEYRSGGVSEAELRSHIIGELEALDALAVQLKKNQKK
jgi:hypothetical protein